MKRLALAALLATVASAATAQVGNQSGSDNRWNVTGPNWYETKCGQMGFSATHGLPNGPWRKPCSVPVRVCEYQRLTMNYIADPDVPCERMAKPDATGPLVRTYLKTWD